MTVKELRTLVDNIDEYIRIPGGIDRLKNTILHLAITGQLTRQDLSEGTGSNLSHSIEIEKARRVKEGKLKRQKPLGDVSSEAQPFKIPDSWKWQYLESVCDVITDGDHQPPPKQESGIPFAVIGDVRDGNLNIDRISRKVSAEYFAKLDWSHKPLKGDLLYTTVGSYGIAIPITEQVEFCFQRHIGLIRPSILSMQDFILIYLRTSFAFDQATACSTGIAQKTVPVSGLRRFLFPLPPLAEQQRIIERVRKVLTLIELLEVTYESEQDLRHKLAATLFFRLGLGEAEAALKHLTEIIKTKDDANELRKAIFRLAISGHLVPHNTSEGSGEELYSRIQQARQRTEELRKTKKKVPRSEVREFEKPFEIPENWKWVTPVDIGEVNPRNSAPDGTQAGFIRMANISERYGHMPEFELRTWGTVKQAFTHFAQGDVVMAKITPCFENSKAGIIPVLPENIGAGTTELHVFRQSASLVNPEYFYLWVKSPFYLNEGKHRMTGSAGQKRVPTSFFANFPIPLPPIDEQGRIVDRATLLLALVDELEQHLEK